MPHNAQLFGTDFWIFPRRRRLRLRLQRRCHHSRRLRYNITLLLLLFLLYYYYTYIAVHAKYRPANSPDDRRQLGSMSIFQSRACEFVPTEETKIITLLLYAPNPKSRKRWYIILYIYNVIIIILYMLSGFDNIIMLILHVAFILLYCYQYIIDAMLIL